MQVVLNKIKRLNRIYDHVIRYNFSKYLTASCGNLGVKRISGMILDAKFVYYENTFYHFNVDW